ncbi:hypothetical protein NX059_005790 [Plenodomus lindquistii]|nr:hypothetical protein NX059_005790 [Plenodomus lindquistii]
MSTTPAGPSALSPAVAKSPFFLHMPPELRRRVYDFVFGDSPVLPVDADDAPTPVSSQLGLARLVSHQFDDEARKAFFADTIHILNWDRQRVSRNSGVYMDRISSLEPHLLQQIKQIEFRIEHGNVSYIDPLHLEMNPDNLSQSQQSTVHRGLQVLESIRIVLDLPFIATTEGRQKRIETEGRLAAKISGFKSVNKVIVYNIYYRDRFPYHEEGRKQHWTIVEWEDDSNKVNDDR